MKDNFSSHSSDYARYRPTFPGEIFELTAKLVPGKSRAWDCGTGNGQVAGELAEIFREVKATDISDNQLQNAVNKPNITYSVQPAEKTVFPNHHFNLITVGQAVHWFNFNSFYKEVKRCSKPGGIILILGYGLLKGNKETTRIIKTFYKEIMGPYWDPERKYLDAEYKTIPFPFTELNLPKFEQKVNWDFEHLIGYLKTWSGVNHYREKEGRDPVDLITSDLKRAFGEKGKIVFPTLIKIGRVD